jgi:hypothetical protein
MVSNVSPLACHSIKYYVRMTIPLAHRLISMVAAVSLFVPPLVAQTVGNLYGGYSFLSNDLHIEEAIGESGVPSASGRGNLNGWNVSAEVKVFRWLGAVADFDGSNRSGPVTGCSPFVFNHPTHSNTSL